MAILQITTDQEFLRKKSKIVEVFDMRLHTLIDDMYDTLRDAKGIGLAAVQIGVLYRIALVVTPNGILELINPEIIESDKTKLGEEGCLSVDGVRLEILRPQRITVKAQDRYGMHFTIELKNLSAVCACHEIDHLNGILFIDRVRGEK